MLDFIFSANPDDLQKMQVSLSRVYEDYSPLLEDYSGPWGALVIQKNALFEERFKTLETDECVLFVIGEPVCLNELAADENSCSAHLLDIFNGASTPDVSSFLSGGFLVFCLNKPHRQATVYTDLLSMIPSYSFYGNGQLVIGSHVDLVAEISEQRTSYDLASLAEFTLNASVTYPHTCYEGVKQLAPASKTLFEFPDIRNPRFSSHFYWKPFFGGQLGNVDQIAEEASGPIPRGRFREAGD